jgi:hypothetical protein
LRDDFELYHLGGRPGVPRKTSTFSSFSQCACCCPSFSSLVICLGIIPCIQLAYLWRKIACLACIQSGKSLAGTSFSDMDCISGRWFRAQSTSKIHSKTCGVIKRGDEFYKSMLYSHAVSEVSWTFSPCFMHRSHLRTLSRIIHTDLAFTPKF